MPSMCVPVLEMDGGNKMPETMAIARYLAREFGKLTNVLLLNERLYLYWTKYLKQKQLTVIYDINYQVKIRNVDINLRIIFLRIWLNRILKILFMSFWHVAITEW